MSTKRTGAPKEMPRETEPDGPGTMPRRSLTCPHCRKHSHFNIKINLKRIHLIPDADETSTPPQPDDTTVQSNVIDCPHCRRPIQVVLDVRVLRTIPAELGEDERHRGRREAEEYLIRQIRAAGMLEPFAEAVRAAHPSNIPGDMTGALLTFLQTCTPLKDVPREIVNRFSKEFPGRGGVAFWSMNGVVAVVANRLIRYFIPIYHIRGRTSNTLGNGGGKLWTPPNPADLDRWIRTRNGYVSGEGAFLDELAGRKPGDFARAGGNY